MIQQRILLALLALAAVLALPLAGIGQDGGDPDQDPDVVTEDEDGPAPLGVTAVRLPERQRLTKEIEGSWLLVNFQSGTEPVDPNSVSGFAQFQNGYSTMLFEAVEDNVQPPYVGGVHVQGGAHRYKISDFLTLQLATIMGFDSFNKDSEVVLESTSFPREYQIKLQGDMLTLSRMDGTTFWFSRMAETEFPLEALDALEQAKSGR